MYTYTCNAEEVRQRIDRTIEDDLNDLSEQQLRSTWRTSVSDVIGSLCDLVFQGLQGCDQKLRVPVWPMSGIEGRRELLMNGLLWKRYPARIIDWGDFSRKILITSTHLREPPMGCSKEEWLKGNLLEDIQGDVIRHIITIHQPSKRSICHQTLEKQLGSHNSHFSCAVIAYRWSDSVIVWSDSVMQRGTDRQTARPCLCRAFTYVRHL